MNDRPRRFDDFDRDRHQHNGVWFERVAPHSPHYVQCSPDGVPTFEPTKGNMMDVEKMSNEELIFKYFYSGSDNPGEHATMAVEIQNRLRTSMHWLPMTPDAVFEDGKIYLLRDGEDGSYALAIWDSDGGRFYESWMSPIDKTIIGHYARITEPK